MNRTQTQILTLIATLPVEQRRELVEHIYDADLFGARFADRLTPEQQSDLEASIAEAERGDVVQSHQVFDDLARTYGFTRLQKLID